MSKALELMKKISEIGYYGLHNDYSTQPYDNDTEEYMKPFADLQLPDKAGMPDVQQTGRMPRKSRGEDGETVTN